MLQLISCSIGAFVSVLCDVFGCCKGNDIFNINVCVEPVSVLMKAELQRNNVLLCGAFCK